MWSGAPHPGLSPLLCLLPFQDRSLEPRTFQEGWPLGKHSPQGAPQARGIPKWRSSLCWDGFRAGLQIGSNFQSQGRSWQVGKKYWRGSSSPGGHGPHMGGQRTEGPPRGWEQLLECLSWPLPDGGGHL